MKKLLLVALFSLVAPVMAEEAEQPAVAAVVEEEGQLPEAKLPEDGQEPA